MKDFTEGSSIYWKQNLREREIHEAVVVLNTGKERYTFQENFLSWAYRVLQLNTPLILIYTKERDRMAVNSN